MRIIHQLLGNNLSQASKSEDKKDGRKTTLRTFIYLNVLQIQEISASLLVGSNTEFGV